MSKYAEFVAAIVSDTGIVRLPFEVEVREICPWYVPTAKETVGLTETVITSGVVQQLVPDLEIVSHAPPVDVVALAVKVKFVPVLVTVMICGREFAPPNGFVKASAGICEKVCAAAKAGKKIQQNARMQMT